MQKCLSWGQITDRSTIFPEFEIRREGLPRPVDTASIRECVFVRSASDQNLSPPHSNDPRAQIRLYSSNIGHCYQPGIVWVCGGTH